MLTVDFSYDEEANTVPYPPLFDNTRRNHGFVDVRGRPDLAAEIVEGGISPALRNFLVGIAAQDSSLVSLGCDLGEHEIEASRCMAGGYVQWIMTPPNLREPDTYQALAEALVRELDPLSEGHSWQFSFVIKFVDLKLDDVGLVPSQWVWFDAEAESVLAAHNSRELLLENLAKVAAAIDVSKLQALDC